ncbi:MAG: ABC transporter ATP-binding protein [Acidimicrobiales bacterium]
MPEVSLQLEPGAVTTLVGPNGSGKSTVLNALARLVKPDGGAVYLDGRDIARLPTKEVARRLALLPQGLSAPGGVSVRELVGYGRYPHQGLLGTTTAEDADAVAWAISATGTTPLADRAVDSLSGGERQRAWMAMALAQRAGVLLLDEPTTFLDIRYQVEVLGLVRRLVDEEGITVGMVLHDLNQAASVSDRMAFLSAGRMVTVGPPGEVMTTETISAVFEVEVTVLTDPATGLPTCLPYGRPALLR